MTDELVAPPAPDPIHALLEAAAEHQPSVNWAGYVICEDCEQSWPCLVARLAAEVHALRKERRDD